MKGGAFDSTDEGAGHSGSSTTAPSRPLEGNAAVEQGGRLQEGAGRTAEQQPRERPEEQQEPEAPAGTSTGGEKGGGADAQKGRAGALAPAEDAECRLGSDFCEAAAKKCLLWPGCAAARWPGLPASSQHPVCR